MFFDYSIFRISRLLRNCYFQVFVTISDLLLCFTLFWIFMQLLHLLGFLCNNRQHFYDFYSTQKNTPPIEQNLKNRVDPICLESISTFDKKQHTTITTPQSLTPSPMSPQPPSKAHRFHRNQHSRYGHRHQRQYHQHHQHHKYQQHNRHTTTVTNANTAATKGTTTTTTTTNGVTATANTITKTTATTSTGPTYEFTDQRIQFVPTSG